MGPATRYREDNEALFVKYSVENFILFLNFIFILLKYYSIKFYSIQYNFILLD